LNDGFEFDPIRTIRSAGYSLGIWALKMSYIYVRKIQPEAL
jgi:hypothetical protein